MKRWWIICCLLFAGVITSAQTRDALLEHINRIKLDTEQYLYGICTLTDSPDQALAEKEARLALSEQVSDYCQYRQFLYIRNLEDISKESVVFISCPLYDNCIRSIAYMSKEVLEQAESIQSKIMMSQERIEKIQLFMDCLKKARLITEVNQTLQEMGTDIFARWGSRYDDQTMDYIINGFLVYYDDSTGEILQIMTPVDNRMARHDFKSGAPANPLKYKTTPLWIYIEGYSFDL